MAATAVRAALPVETTPARVRARIQSVDVQRGIVMVILPTLYPPGYGYDLWVVSAIWILIVAALYPVCRWFAAVKARRRSVWLSYL